MATKLNAHKIALCLLCAGMVVPQGIAQLTDDEAIHLRASELVAKMTVEEKVGQLNQVSGQSNPGPSRNNLDSAIEQGQVGSILWLVDVSEINRLQHLAVEKTRLHIPLLVGNDVVQDVYKRQGRGSEREPGVPVAAGVLQRGFAVGNFHRSAAGGDRGLSLIHISRARIGSKRS